MPSRFIACGPVAMEAAATHGWPVLVQTVCAAEPTSGTQLTLEARPLLALCNVASVLVQHLRRDLKELTQAAVAQASACFTVDAAALTSDHLRCGTAMALLAVRCNTGACVYRLHNSVLELLERGHSPVQQVALLLVVGATLLGTPQSWPSGDATRLAHSLLAVMPITPNDEVPHDTLVYCCTVSWSCSLLAMAPAQVVFGSALALFALQQHTVASGRFEDVCDLFVSAPILSFGA